jgi:hypothetical protein
MVNMAEWRENDAFDEERTWQPLHTCVCFHHFQANKAVEFYVASITNACVMQNVGKCAKMKRAAAGHSREAALQAEGELRKLKEAKKERERLHEEDCELTLTHTHTHTYLNLAASNGLYMRYCGPSLFALIIIHLRVLFAV